MNTKGKNQESNISILEAIETLSDIADLEILPEIGVTERHNMMIANQDIMYRSVRWIHHHDHDDLMVRLKNLKEIFKVILVYLKDSYKKQDQKFDNHQRVEGMKNIMVLVGEAAKKLDRYKDVFHFSASNNITEWDEYKSLQEFYQNRISHQIDEGVLSRWILGLALKTFHMESPSSTVTEKSFQARHVFVDLEAVKKDSEYELFFIRKEDGSRFYSPKLIRNIKLICDFGDRLDENKIEGPLADLYTWQDRFIYTSAKELYASLHHVIRTFYEIGVKHSDKEIVDRLSKAIMALMLCSYDKHLSKYSPSKTCLEYFQDFQVYMRDILQTREYLRLVAYPPDPSDRTAFCIMDTIQALCYHYFKSMRGYQEMIAPIQSLLIEAKQEISSEHLETVKDSAQLWNRLGCDYAALMKLTKHYSNRPLIKVLDILEENHTHVFDTMMQGNIPGQLFGFYMNQRKIDCLYLPSPIRQEAIDKAIVTEEFKGFLRDMKAQNLGEMHLLINLQDRTSWREQARCKVLEELQFKEEFHNQLIVMTLPKDVEFYYQLPPYQDDKIADHFLKHFKQYILDEKMGFFFPDNMRKMLTEEVVDELLSAIHRLFFHHTNILLQEQRLDFIELFYQFLTLKMIEWSGASSFSFTCKDGVDIGASSHALLYAMMQLLHEEKLTENQIEYINVLLYAPALLVRERMIAPERFKRMLSALKVFESIREEHGSLNFLKTMQEAFGLRILDSMIVR